MSENSYQTYHRELVLALGKTIKNTPPFNGDELDELQAELQEKLELLTNNSTDHQQFMETGQWLLLRIVSSFQQFMSYVPRDLFWYFGGDCLHYLEDHEIDHFQALDERFHSANQDNTNYAELVANTDEPKGTLH